MRLKSKCLSVSAITVLAALVGSCGGKGECGGLVGPCPTPTPTATPAASLTGSRTLAIAPRQQQTDVWCWASSAEMVFRFYGLPSLNPVSYQCGIVAAWFGGACLIDCSQCRSPIGPMSNQLAVIQRYGPYAQSLFIPSRVLSATLVFRSLTAAEVKAEIDAGRPIVIGIAPGGGFALPNASAHIAVLIGYDFNGGAQDAVVNDPYPFEFVPQPNPYVSRGGRLLQPGQYRISIAALQVQLQWANTIYRIQ